MRAVMLEVPEELLEQRRQLGIDVFDEVWDGVLHMVPPPSSRHQRFGLEIGAFLLAVAKNKGLVAMYEAGLFRPGTDRLDYRVPDLIVARPDKVSERGVEGRAELVVEILSPGDETYEKLGFYAEVGVQELLVIDPTTAVVELFVLRDAGLHAEPAGPNGSVTAESVGVSLATEAGGRLRLDWDSGTAII